jgi:hypothetical protein
MVTLYDGRKYSTPDGVRRRNAGDTVLRLKSVRLSRLWCWSTDRLCLMYCGIRIDYG